MTTAGYSGTREHLLEELGRVDQLIRAQVVRWRLTLAQTKPEQLWGMVHVTEQEVDAFLQAPFVAFDELPAELAGALAPYWDRADAAGRQIARRLEETEPGVSRLSRLVGRFSLSALERDILLVALLPTLDERYRRLFGYLQDDCSRTTPTIGLISQVLQGTARSAAVRAALAVDAPLRVWRVVDVEPVDMKPASTRGLLVEDRIAAFLSDQDRIDEHLASIVEIEDPGAAVARTGRASWPSFEAVLDWVAARDPGDPPPICLVEGPPGGRGAAARSLCGAAGARMLVADVRAAIRSPLEWTEVVLRVYREAALAEAWATWRGCEALESDAQHRILLRTASGSPEGSVMISEGPLRDGALLHGRPVVRVQVPLSGPAERERTWDATLVDVPLLSGDTAGAAGLASDLARLYRLSSAQIRGAAVLAGAAARARDPRCPAVTADDLAAGCRAQTAVQSSGIAQRLEPRVDLTLETLVVPPPIMAQIDELGGRIRARHSLAAVLGPGASRSAHGVTAMFTGPSGCGKTLAAEALASEHRVDLYRVDLSAVVSKYVGETEKNLARVFSDIQDTNGILFFDEADALFGKRGEVVDARDRWANTEVNYLLQTLERYEGVVILATNLRQNIDSAFTRRIQVVIEFPFPDAAARLAMWRASLGEIDRPPDAELQAVAERFQLTGGSIANVALDAVFRGLANSGSETPEVTLNHLLAAIAAEYRRLGKPITRGEFGSELYERAMASEQLVARP